jgi:hypothetical protein
MVKESQLQFVSSAPAFQVKGFVPQACYVIENSSGPDSVALYLVFENAVRGGRPFATQFRCGVDTRPEMLASQLLLTMDAILRDSERQVHQCSSEFRGPANPAKAAEQEEKAGVWDLCLDDVKSGWIAQDDCVFYEVPADAVSMNYIIQTVQNVARRGGGERPPDKKLKAGEKEEVQLGLIILLGVILKRGLLMKLLGRNLHLIFVLIIMLLIVILIRSHLFGM